MNKLHKNIVIYTIIVALSLIPSLVLFNKGFVDGHDNAFHFAQIQDLYDSWKNKDVWNYISEQCNHKFGMGVKLMYAPLSHMIAVIIGFIIIPFGFTLTSAMKATIYLSIVFSAIFTYHFIKNLTKNELAGLLAAIIYMLFPYRFTDIYIRNAYAETIAMAFIPLIFDGIYRILKMKEFRTKPFIITILGTVTIFLTHNITAIYTFVFILIFVLFHYKDLKNLIKRKEIWISSIISLFLIICLISPLLFPLLEHKLLNIYRIFDPKSMNTSLDNVVAEVDRSFIFLSSGLDYSYFANIIYFVFISILSYITFKYTKNYINNKTKSNLIIFIISSAALLTSIIISLVSKISFIIYIAIIFEANIFIIPKTKTNESTNKNTIISIVVLFVLVLLLSTTKPLWHFVPKFLYTIQFAWRLWVFVGFFGGILISLIYNNLAKKYDTSNIHFVGALLTTILLVIMKPILPSSYQTSSEQEIDITDTYNIYSAGWQLEYFPVEFFEGSKSKYFWDCYMLMQQKTDATITKVGVINGKAEQSNYSLNEGIITFHLETEEKTLIELPRVYYLGYEITITTKDGIVHQIDNFQNEGLLSFETELSGDVKVEYIGTKLMNSANYFFVVGISLLTILPITYNIYIKKRNTSK